MHALLIDAVINLEQHLALFDLVKVLYVNAGHVAVDLRADKSGQAAHVGVIGKLTVAGKRR